ncbi:MAG: ATP-binding protein [Pseudomonadota bacterium]|uniref:ATP-binding protein n=1 Tax=Pseudoalteromonas sp. XMcav1-K TaxID=3374372 RepID=UPI002E9F33F8|nr:ATP-binding protein [Pseudomonadota bacterium]
MKKLYISLITGALISSFILGWLIDSLSAPPSNHDNFKVEKQILAGVVAEISHHPKSGHEAFLKRFTQASQFSLSYHSNSELALPRELHGELLVPGGITLEDELGFYLIQTSAALADSHIQLRVEKPPMPTNRTDLFLTVGFYLGICIFMWWWLAPLTKRLSLLNKATAQFANGNLDARINLTGLSYIRELETSYNRMADQIQQLIEENQLLASSMSHDIRTPLACLRFGLDAAIDTKDPTKIRHYLERMENDLDQMESMLNSYLEYATLEQKSYQISPTVITSTELFDNCFYQVEPKLKAQSIKLEIKSDTQQLYVDPHWLARAIVNLLSNATDFAKTTITISTTQTHADTFIEIEDDGPGIDEANLDNVLKPFFQQENHRNRAAKNYGLGLAIVAKVIAWHFGDIKVSRSKELGGAKFTLRLPHRCHLKNKTSSW